MSSKVTSLFFLFSHILNFFFRVHIHVISTRVQEEDIDEDWCMIDMTPEIDASSEIVRIFEHQRKVPIAVRYFKHRYVYIN